MHSECKLIRIQHAVVVDVRELPDLAKDGVGKSWLDELRLGCSATDLPVNRTEPVKYLVVLVAISRDDPLVCMVTSPVYPFTFTDTKRTFIVAVKCTALHMTSKRTFTVAVKCTALHMTIKRTFIVAVKCTVLHMTIKRTFTVAVKCTALHMTSKQTFTAAVKCTALHMTINRFTACHILYKFYSRSSLTCCICGKPDKWQCTTRKWRSKKCRTKVH